MPVATRLHPSVGYQLLSQADVAGHLVEPGLQPPEYFLAPLENEAVSLDPSKYYLPRLQIEDAAKLSGNDDTSLGPNLNLDLVVCH